MNFGMRCPRAFNIERSETFPPNSSFPGILISITRRVIAIAIT